MSKDTSTPFPLERLPEEVQEHILNQLDHLRDIISISHTSVDLKRINASNYWQAKYQTFFGNKLPEGYESYSEDAFNVMKAICEKNLTEDITDKHDKDIALELLSAGYTPKLTELNQPIFVFRIFCNIGFLHGINQMYNLDIIQNNPATHHDNLPIRLAVVADQLDAVKLLVEKGVDPALYGNYPLIKACGNGKDDMVHFLLGIDSVRENATVQENIPLREAALNGKLAIVQRLLEIDEVKRNAHVKCNYALLAAYHMNHSAIVDCLLEVREVREEVLNNQSIHPLTLIQKAERAEHRSDHLIAFTQNIGFIDDENAENVENESTCITPGHPRKPR